MSLGLDGGVNMKTCRVYYLRKMELLLSETRAESTEIISAEIQEERLRLFRHDVALDVYYTFHDYAPCSNEAERGEGSIEKIACFDAWISTMVAWLTEREKRGGHQ